MLNLNLGSGRARCCKFVAEWRFAANQGSGESVKENCQAIAACVTGALTGFAVRYTLGVLEGAAA